VADSMDQDVRVNPNVYIKTSIDSSLGKWAAFDNRGHSR
jgi:hypothetical protein